MERLDPGVGQNAARLGELHEEVNEGEQVDIGVVDGELDEDGACVDVDPLVGHQLSHQGLCLALGRAQIGDVTPAPIQCQQAVRWHALQVEAAVVSVGLLDAG